MKYYFEPININQWNLFNEVKGVGHIEFFLASKQMKIGDTLLIYVGKQSKSIESGVYAVGKIISDPLICQDEREKYCYGKQSVKVEILSINYNNPIINYQECKNFVSQYRTKHKINESYYNIIENKLKSKNICLGVNCTVNDDYDCDYEKNNHNLKELNVNFNKVVVCNITWMNKYAGIESNNYSNWRFVKENGFGFELNNFFNKNGFYYGYTQMSNRKINLNRIDRNSKEDILENVLVIWLSKNPKGSLTVVGYYIDATVYRYQQHSVFAETPEEGYYFKAKVKNSYLIPVEKRIFKFPEGRNGRPGQASIWYADNIELRKRLVDYIVNVEKNRLKFIKERPLINQDDNNDIISTNDIDTKEKYNPSFSPVKIKKRTSKGRIIYSRDHSKAKGMIKYSNYKCNIDPNHESFISKNGSQYMEAHHLIPLSVQEKFTNSLDIDANIICLCPTCHKKLHYGKHINGELEQLFNNRKELLKKSGIDISFEDLQIYYTYKCGKSTLFDYIKGVKDFTNFSVDCILQTTDL